MVTEKSRYYILKAHTRETPVEAIKYMFSSVWKECSQRGGGLENGLDQCFPLEIIFSY